MPYKDKEKQRDCQARFRKKKYAKNRLAWFKKNGPCKVIESDDSPCGSWENLHCDHIDRLKKVSHRIWTWSVKHRNEELRKCQVLCEYHHIEKCSAENRGELPLWAKFA